MPLKDTLVCRSLSINHVSSHQNTIFSTDFWSRATLVNLHNRTATLLSENLVPTTTATNQRQTTVTRTSLSIFYFPGHTLFPGEYRERSSRATSNGVPGHNNGSRATTTPQPRPQNATLPQHKPCRKGPLTGPFPLYLASPQRCNPLVPRGQTTSTSITTAAGSYNAPVPPLDLSCTADTHRLARTLSPPARPKVTTKQSTTSFVHLSDIWIDRFSVLPRSNRTSWKMMTNQLQQQQTLRNLYGKQEQARSRLLKANLPANCQKPKSLFIGPQTSQTLMPI